MDLNATLAARGYAASRPALAADPGSGGGPGAALHDLGADFVSTLERSEDLSRQAVTGGGDPHALVEALAQTEMAVQTAVTVRDKVVEAYQEILRMPV